jgi:hypothetical protein
MERANCSDRLASSTVFLTVGNEMLVLPLKLGHEASFVVFAAYCMYHMVVR